MMRPLAWLGDDFTGAAAVMEVLTFGGAPSVLFLDAPTPAQLGQFPADTCIGIASMARTRDPAWMDAHLPALYAALAATAAELIHYKVCSTLDSAPQIGSIGRAMDIGAAAFAPACIPVLVAAPRMRRYQAFGHLFAAAPEGVFRLDRHPVMAHHPVTPMGESDVARHLAAQTSMPIGCHTLEDLAARHRLPGGDGPPCAMTIDMMGPADESRAGALIWQGRAQNRFVVGSQGIEYALVRHWQETGAIAPPPAPAGLGRADAMAVVSGSVSPVTAAQIGWARHNGFDAIAFDTASVCGDAATRWAAIEKSIARAFDALGRGAIPLVHSAEGPGDPRVAALRENAGRLGAAEINDRIGAALGQILRALVEKAGVRRVVASGGDTTGHVCRALDLFALTALAPTIPGAPICAAAGPWDGLQIGPKGGQMGSADYFGWVRDGGGAR